MQDSRPPINQFVMIMTSAESVQAAYPRHPSGIKRCAFGGRFLPKVVESSEF